MPTGHISKYQVKSDTDATEDHVEESARAKAAEAPVAQTTPKFSTYLDDGVREMPLQVNLGETAKLLKSYVFASKSK